MNTVNRLEDEARAESSRRAETRRATGIPTNVLDAQQRIRRDGTLAPTHSFATPFQRGEIINGKYRVRELLGVGGVGFVVSATHLQLDDGIALKVLKPEFASHPEAVRSFQLEARASFKIKSEHIVRVHDVDVLPSGVPFMVMELLEGQDLRRLLKQYRYLSIDQAVDVALQTCEALAAAHACQIVHRDIKPENLFVTPSAESAHVKVLDFGISQALLSAADSGAAATPGMISVGTPPYMSPEQIRGSNELDARADMWSLGCVLYELLTGVAPFARMSIMQSCAAVLEDEPSPLRDGRPDAPLELEHVVMRCLCKDPGQRFLNVAELANALAPFGKHSVYCADRCVSLLSKDARGHVTVNGRSQAPRDTLARRLATNSESSLGSARVRRHTMNPLSTPVSFTARKPSSLRLATAAAPEAPPADVQEDTDMSFVPGLRPRRTGWLVFAASASIAIILAYMALAEFDRSLPDRMSLRKIAAPALRSLQDTYLNAQSENTNSHGEASVTPSADAPKAR